MCTAAEIISGYIGILQPKVKNCYYVADYKYSNMQ